jgi:subtilisin family serine protease
MQLLRSHILSVLVLLAVSQVAVAQNNSTTEYMYYFKERVPLKLDTSRVAVYRPQASGINVQPPNLSARGIGTITQQDMTIPGWYIAPIAPTANRGATVSARNLVLDLAIDPDIDFAAPVFIGDDGGTVIPTPTILVAFNFDLTGAECVNIIEQMGIGEVIESDFADAKNLYKIRSFDRSGFAVLDAANTLAVHPDVRYAEPNMQFTGHGALTPTDPDFGSSWGLHNDGTGGAVLDMDMNGPEAWDISTGDASVLVAVIDTGVDTTHPDMNQVTGTDVTSNAGEGGPINVLFDWHGTLVAGCISQLINNELSTTGIAPSCKSVSIRTFQAGNSAGGWNSETAWTVSALAWAEANGVKVTNNSNAYGASLFSSTIADKYASTKANGMIHFAASGNNGSSTIAYPASLSTVNAVGALDDTGTKAGFSQFGTGQQFCAPGVGILMTDIQGTGGRNTFSGVSGNYVTEPGTSFASPYTAGVAALIISEAPFLTPTEIETVMEDTAKDRGAAGYDTTYGWGLPDARAALEATSLDYSGYWVNHTHSGLEIGTEVYPVIAFTDGLALVPDSETLHIESGTYTQSTSITQAVTLVAENGTVTLDK